MRTLSLWQRAVTLTTLSLISFFDRTPHYAPSAMPPSGTQQDVESLSLTLSFGNGRPISSIASTYRSTTGRSSLSTIRSEMLASLHSAAGSLLLQIGAIAARFYTRAVVQIWRISSSRESYMYWIAPVQVESSFHGLRSRQSRTAI